MRALRLLSASSGRVKNHWLPTSTSSTGAFCLPLPLWAALEAVLGLLVAGAGAGVGSSKLSS